MGWRKQAIALIVAMVAGVAGRVGAAEGPAVFTQQPADQTVVIGTSATFSVDVDGSEPLVVQWFRNGVPVEVRRTRC